MTPSYVLKKPQNVIQKTQNILEGRQDVNVKMADAKSVPYGTHDRLREDEGPPNITGIVKAHSKPGHGKMVVSSIISIRFYENFLTALVCSNNAMADQIRRAVRKHMDPGVRLVELDYEPSLRRKSEPEMDFSCRGMP